MTCRVLELARQPYYRWLADPVTEVERVEAHRANALFDAHREDPEFGYRYLVQEVREAGESMLSAINVRSHRLADLLAESTVERVRQEAWQERQEARTRRS